MGNKTVNIFLIKKAEICYVEYVLSSLFGGPWHQNIVKPLVNFT